MLVLLDSVAALLHTKLGCGDAAAADLKCPMQLVAQRDVKLVLLDSVAALLRTELGGGDASALAARGEQLGRQAIALKVLAEQHRIPVVVTNQVTARPTGPATHAFQQQQRGLPGGSAATSKDGQLSAALGTKWAHAVNVRLVLERIVEGGEERRFIKVAKSPMSANQAFEYRITPGGVVQVHGTVLPQSVQQSALEVQIANEYAACSGTQQVLGLTAASSAAAGSTAGCPAGPPIVIHDSSKPVLLLPDRNYQFLAGRFVLATTLTLQPGQSCCITGSSNSSRTILLPPKPAAAGGNSTAQQQLHFRLTGGFLVLRNLTVSGYAGGSHRGGGGVLIQRTAAGGAAVDEGGVTPAGTRATLVADNVTFSHISPRAVANIDDTAAAITLRDTSFASNNHSGVTCYEASGGGIGFSWDNFQCYVPSNEAGAAGLTTVSNVTFSGVTRFVGNTWGALHSR
ncbi:hypothetical protein OEZ85_004844 [Tetradesmus obliquus]|uniref:RecA family profile 1 domain-containing protein n=1 Tax=Tetradesmus obliquus TaxID=3088 RepID=A0ABY8UJS4_TETOB|nr:hypothetical protein OEZ85_004844 [Tetradesmus obliquus]